MCVCARALVFSSSGIVTALGVGKVTFLLMFLVLQTFITWFLWYSAYSHPPTCSFRLKGTALFGLMPVNMRDWGSLFTSPVASSLFDSQNPSGAQPSPGSRVHFLLQFCFRRPSPSYLCFPEMLALVSRGFERADELLFPGSQLFGALALAPAFLL